jgi:purine-nucleoside phosphorylase
MSTLKILTQVLLRMPLLLLLNAGLGPVMAAEPVHIGFDSSYGVKTSTADQSIEWGVRAAMEEVNAAGGIRRGLKPGDFVAISDHINFLGTNPLRGPRAPGRERFIDMTAAYDPELRKRTLRVAKSLGMRIREGVYLAVSGPSFETPAEIRAFRTLGADVVGMSTVPEAIVARQCGMRVAGLSCITNVAAGLAGPHQSLSHGEVLDVAREVAPRATRLVEAWIQG